MMPLIGQSALNTNSAHSKLAMANEIYQTADEARQASDAFYADQGFVYTPVQVNQWLKIYLPRSLASVAVMDLCCGDGIWSQGINNYSDNAKIRDGE